jgi:toluene monooxygenase system protein E
MLCDAQMIDAMRHRRWSEALVKMALENEANRAVIQGWINKWEPLADKAIDAYCSGLPDVPDAAADAKEAVRAYRKSLGF